MKRIMFLLPALLLSLLLTGCGREAPATPDTYLPSIMLDGVLYHLSDKGEMSGDVDPSAIQGEITSTVPLTQLPKEHGQANFGSAGDPYAFTSDGLVVLFNNEWTLFVADDLTPADARKYIEEKQFAPGSMLPKVQAALSFAESKPGRVALITLLEKAADGISGKTGTRVHQ